MNFLEFIKHVQPSYVPDWAHLRLIAGLESGEDFLVATPPGLGKSQIFSVLRPAYEIYRDPERAHIILLAHSDGLARLFASTSRVEEATSIVNLAKQRIAAAEKVVEKLTSPGMDQSQATVRDLIREARNTVTQQTEVREYEQSRLDRESRLLAEFKRQFGNVDHERLRAIRENERLINEMRNDLA
jgi:hypothetical protein